MMTISLSEQTAYRVHVPRWAATPTSGQGAAKHGGRVNRIGLNALYLALDVNTALMEYQQVSPLMPPGTLVTYQVTVDHIVDFSKGITSGTTWPDLWEDFYCDWRTFWFNDGIEPPSWIIGDEVIAAGGKGILFRSHLSAGGVNLVLYPDTLGPGDKIAPYDPNGMLPQNQSSWLGR
jgi:RES domain-containing protein